MKFLLLLVIIGVVVAAWRLRVPLMAKVLGQDQSRVSRQLNRKRD